MIKAQTTCLESPVRWEADLKRERGRSWWAILSACFQTQQLGKSSLFQGVEGTKVETNWKSLFHKFPFWMWTRHFLSHYGNMRQVESMSTTTPHSCHYYNTHFTDMETDFQSESNLWGLKIKSEWLKLWTQVTVVPASVLLIRPALSQLISEGGKWMKGFQLISRLPRITFVWKYQCVKDTIINKHVD